MTDANAGFRPLRDIIADQLEVQLALYPDLGGENPIVEELVRFSLGLKGEGKQYWEKRGVSISPPLTDPLPSDFHIAFTAMGDRLRGVDLDTLERVYGPGICLTVISRFYEGEPGFKAAETLRRVIEDGVLTVLAECGEGEEPLGPR